VVIVLITALVLIGAGAAGYWAYTVFGPATPEETESPSPTPEPDVHVSWQEPELLGDLGLIPPEPGATCAVGTDGCVQYFKIGSFTAGPYEGDDLVRAYGYGGLGGNPEHRFVMTATGAVLLQNHSERIWHDPAGPRPIYQTDEQYRIPELTFPSFLDAPYKGVVLQQAPGIGIGFGLRYWERTFEYANLREVMETPYGTLYTDTPRAIPPPAPGPDVVIRYSPQFGFYLRAPDDSVITYVPVYGFMKDDRVDVLWKDGYSRGEYSYFTSGGCGRANYVTVIEPFEFGLEALEQAGTTGDDGWPVYVLRDRQHEMLRAAFEFAPDYLKGSETGYDEFLRSHPIFFIEDPFGNLVRFFASDLIPPAECAKPVIYLYPEATGWFDVTVEPVGGMTVSDPEYGDGWRVRAEPDGTLTHPDTDATYPYLFWEGTGGIYEMPEDGWVVEQDDVDGFLGEKLSALGLNGQEIDDFKEFWLPLMQDAPWYYVTFLGNRHMDALAPLTVSPRPDTVIRVLMDYRELDEPIEVEPPVFRTPERRGFTVVEWGGVRR
jgi:hypothetical protein